MNQYCATMSECMHDAWCMRAHPIVRVFPVQCQQKHEGRIQTPRIQCNFLTESFGETDVITLIVFLRTQKSVSCIKQVCTS